LAEVTKRLAFSKALSFVICCEETGKTCVHDITNNRQKVFIDKFIID